MEYLHFDLSIGSQNQGRYPVTVIQSPAGEAHAQVTFPIHEPSFKNRLEGIEKTRSHAKTRKGGPALARGFQEGQQRDKRMGRPLDPTAVRGEPREIPCQVTLHKVAIIMFEVTEAAAVEKHHDGQYLAHGQGALPPPWAGT